MHHILSLQISKTSMQGHKCSTSSNMTELSCLADMLLPVIFEHIEQLCPCIASDSDTMDSSWSRGRQLTPRPELEELQRELAGLEPVRWDEDVLEGTPIVPRAGALA
jgi:hypothetical protein